MDSEIRPMEVICHGLDCHCNRRREWVKVNGEWQPLEYSVDDPNDPPMTEEEKAMFAKISAEHMAKK